MNDGMHAIRYRWSESSLLGTRGMGPIETSLPAGELAEWDRQLRDHVWAAGAKPGFTFVTHAGVGALIRKHTTGVAEGRPGSDARVLIGEPLTAARALGLTCWSGWEGVAAKPLDWSALALAADRGIEEVRERARTLPAERLAGLLGHLLQAPADGYTVLGDADPPAVICAFGDLLGQFPAFASDEPDDTQAGLPAAVFLQSVSFSATTVTRRRLSADASDIPGLAAFAAAATAAYQAGGLVGITALRRDRPPADLAEVLDWASRAQYVPGIIRDLRLLRLQRSADLAPLTADDILDRIKADAGAVPTSLLAEALHPGLPDKVREVLIGEAVGRVARGGAGDELVSRLTEFAPITLDWDSAGTTLTLAAAARLPRSLFDQAGRRSLLESVARQTSIPALVPWIDDHASDDPDGARAAYSVLVQLARRATRHDIEVLLSREALAGAVRAFSDSAQEQSAQLSALFAFLPRRAISPEAIATLAATGDPVLEAALGALTRKRSFLGWPLRKFARPRSRHSLTDGKTT